MEGWDEQFHLWVQSADPFFLFLPVPFERGWQTIYMGLRRSPISENATAAVTSWTADSNVTAVRGGLSRGKWTNSEQVENMQTFYSPVGNYYLVESWAKDQLDLFKILMCQVSPLVLQSLMTTLVEGQAGGSRRRVVTSFYISYPTP